MNPFLWKENPRPSIFATDPKFVGRYKVPSTTPATSHIHIYSKAHNGNS